MECEEIERTFPSSFRLVPHNVSGILATLWLTMWTECEEFERAFPSSFRLVPHNVSGILSTLWLTMWTKCEEFVSLNEDPYYLLQNFLWHFPSSKTYLETLFT